jgi:vacuolar-type H+-ATPase subunit F/Vma7
MATVAVLGEPEAVQGYALAGAVVLPAVGADAVRRAWSTLDDGTVLVVLTPAAAELLAAEVESGTPPTAVMPA